MPLCALAMVVAAAAPQPAARPLVGPPAPHRLPAEATVWVFGTLLPESPVRSRALPEQPLARALARLRAKEILAPRLDVDPLAFLPGPTYGGNPLPKVYTFGTSVDW